MATLVCAPADPKTFRAAAQWIEEHPPRGFPIKELKNCKVKIRRRKTPEGASYAVVTIIVEKWGKLRFLSFNSDGYVVIQGYGNGRLVKTPPAAFLDGPQESGDCPICGQRRLLLQECRSTGALMGAVRCRGCYHIPCNNSASPVVMPS